MLWTAVACLQREEDEVVCVVYTGDAVEVSKGEMIDKVKVRSFLRVRALKNADGLAKTRFGITLDPATLLFVPLRTRYLVEDEIGRASCRERVS